MSEAQLGGSAQAEEHREEGSVHGENALVGFANMKGMARSVPWHWVVVGLVPLVAAKF